MKFIQKETWFNLKEIFKILSPKFECVYVYCKGGSKLSFYPSYEVCNDPGPFSQSALKSCYFFFNGMKMELPLVKVELLRYDYLENFSR